MKKESEQPAVENNLTPKRKLYAKAALVTLAAVIVIVGVTKITTSQKEVPLPTSVNSVSNSAVVTADANGFTPATITIKKGATVTWQNTDSDTYSQIVADPSATSNDSQLPDLSSPRLDADGTYSFTFNQVGSFNYHDAMNEPSEGTVIVVQ